jgi:hypothetical protein
MIMNELNGEQRRQLIDTQQAYGAWREAHLDHNRRFLGSMRWAAREGADYLLRKIGRSEKSLGPRDPKTEAAYRAFVEGRKENKSRLEGLSQRLNNIAPVNRAMGLARIPAIAARILRQCDERGLLGKQLFVVGTNALYAYEVLSGVHVQSDLLASGDIDLLLDARRHLSLALAGVRADGLIGLLRKVDRSFSASPRSFRAANRDGYMVDLIRPEARDVFRDHKAAALTDLPDDLEGAAIFGLSWLINSPKLDAVAIDERGYPVRVVVIDPRAFALHKAWLSARPDRDPLKAPRDLAQAKAAALIATRYLRRSFDDPDLAALPASLRERAALLATAGSGESTSGTPDW